MGVKSLKKRSKKSSPEANLANSADNSMAPFASSLWRRWYWIALMLVSAAVCVAILVSISSDKARAFVSVANADRIYGIEVVHEYPHDPQAFTQVYHSTRIRVVLF